MVKNCKCHSNKLIKNNTLMKNSKQFISHILESLQTVPEISEYNKVYLKRLLYELPYRVKIYESLFSELKGDLSKLSIVDYGGGSGLLSSYAKWLGVGKVTYVDIFEQSTIDAKIIAESLNLKADKYITGDITAIDEYVDAIISTDVIEHIYSLEDFFETCYKVNPNMIQLHATGSNPYNPIIRRRLEKLQIKDENEYLAPTEGKKSMDEYRAFKEIRRDWLIENYKEDLSVDEIENISKLTRGYRLIDMPALVDNYLKTNIYPSGIKHPTNTCDPTTGNWTERLTTQKEMQEICNPYNWLCSFESIGFNSKQKSFVKNSIWTLLNLSKTLLRSKSKYVLPLIKIIIK